MTDEQPPATEPTAAAASASPSDRDTVTVRRSPRYGRFIILGAGLGAVITFALTNLFPIDEEVGFAALFGYFLLFGVPIGAALGGLLAVLLDIISSRRATQLEAERSTVESPDEEPGGEN